MDQVIIDDSEFYDEQSQASQVKSRIVTKYFKFWTAVMLGQKPRRLAYVDLYCGPGRYRNGQPSTPMLIMEQVLASEQLREKMVTIFNDADPNHIEQLIANLGEMEGIGHLANEPLISVGAVGEAFEKGFADVTLVPTFTFVDPFGYKGVTLKLLSAMLKDWGCDLVLFFSYNRINAAITNDCVEDHVVSLFGGLENVEQLRVDLTGKTPEQREAIILDTFARALKDRGFKYVLPFRFQQAGRKRTSHSLIFVSKAALGYHVMKDIMAKESSEFEQGVPSFGFTPPVSQEETPLLFELSRPLEELGDALIAEFEGQTLSMQRVFERHNVDTRFIKKNYKDALVALEAAGAVECDPAKRKPRHGKPTMADDVRVTFPKRGA